MSRTRKLLINWPVAAVVLAAVGLSGVALAGAPAIGDAAAAGWAAEDYATGDWGGRRGQFAEQGYDFRFTYIAEGWENTTGGLDQGALYTGLLKFGSDINFDKLLPWQGLKFSTTWLWLSGKDASADLVGNSLTTSNIAGFSTWRLYEFWLEQSFFSDKFSMRVGWMGWDSEFATSNYSGLFLNGTFGWPAYLYQNLPGGGPGYPMTGIGWRFALQATDWLTLRSVIGHGNILSQRDNPNGFGYASYAKTGVLWMSEAESHANPGGLPARYTLGGWFNSKDVQRPDDPAQSYPSNYGLYFIVDQKLTRASPAGSTPDERGLGWFVRLGWSPGDRSLVGFYIDTGLNWTGLIPGREDDRLGLGIAWEEFGYAQRSALRSAGSVAVGHETLIEATYSIAIAKWLTLQPDLQCVIHPGGTGDLGNALVIGARLTADF
jgi:porin